MKICEEMGGGDVKDVQGEMRNFMDETGWKRRVVAQTLRKETQNEQTNWLGEHLFYDPPPPPPLCSLFPNVLLPTALRTTPGFKAYRTVTFDTLKLYTQAHSHKTMNLIINLDHDEWILSDMSKTLAECGAVNETEYSYFNREMYEEYKKNPQVSQSFFLFRLLDANPTRNTVRRMGWMAGWIVLLVGWWKIESRIWRRCQTVKFDASIHTNLVAMGTILKEWY